MSNKLMRDHYIHLPRKGSYQPPETDIDRITSGWPVVAMWSQCTSRDLAM